ncbi:MAG: FAD-binding protein [Alicyclobacillus macrosporangiidus]|uniref:FAD-binding protein n=1 Tax=Alicyclobacillus macrosporangiidus TaxID=392015 RepID=UPI0026E9A2AF|nr:FAD-binding protein [Alicyclobacillus macrosporangiidus]MCL6600155.1 FAD-binding protein [Alicyclobacillus macrosporangiidus]
MRAYDCDLLILGSGGAGLFAAHHASDVNPNLRILLAAKGLVGKSGCTRMVQGGYNVVLHPDDSLERHFMDTLKGGGYINNQELAWTLVSDAPKRILELEKKMGCFFDRNPDGTIHQKPFAGQSFDRTVHRGDLTGIEIISRLRDQLYARENVTTWDEVRGIDLLIDPDDGCCMGAVLLDIRSGELIAVRATAVIVCTGGPATMYKIAAPSLEKAGDGLAMCYRAGTRFVDMEMMQFHPTGLLAKNSRLNGAVLEEGLRGAGGHLLNARGERFMERYDPVNMERSTRDRVARAEFMEIMAGRGTELGGVYIDVSHLGRDKVLKMFPGMVDRCRDVGRDLSQEPVEVSPTAHFHMGGVVIDKDCATDIPGLYVAGEDAGGVHGANRLGGNGVADSTVFGARAGEAAARYVAEAKARPRVVRTEVLKEIEQRVLQPFDNPDGENPFQVRKELNELMWEKVGLVRDAEGLEAALAKLEELDVRSRSLKVKGGRAFNPAWQESLNLRNLILVARMVATAALTRRESRGSHYRTDYPLTNNDEWFANIFLQAGDSGLRISVEPVRQTRVDVTDLLPKMPNP